MDELKINKFKEELDALPLEDAQALLIDKINSAGDALAQYSLLIRLSTAYPALSKEERASCQLVKGCQSRVWLAAKKHGEKMSIRADSDTIVVRGILALFILLLSGRTVQEIEEVEITFIAKTELRESLSSSRISGLRSILHDIKSAASDKTGCE